MQRNEHEDKIGVLNRCLAAMLSAFSEPDFDHGRIHIGVVAFGGERARLHIPLVPAPDARWTDMVAGGKTPMGSAFDLVRKVLEDEEAMPERVYEPALILVSDGVPTDDWEPALSNLLANSRGARALRAAIGIGADRTPDADEVLAAFGSPEIGVLRADQAERLPELFQSVTQAVTGDPKAKSATPKLEDLGRS
jgi:uncharacterized protein YegL